MKPKWAEKYRSEARRLLEVTGATAVDDTAGVSHSDDGAWVEARIWVPDSYVEKAADRAEAEAELQAELENKE